jgi:anti-sigma factor RsiW
VSKPDRDIERLNAYVDGELDAGEAARVAAEVANDRPTGRMVASLHGMKSAVETAFLAADDPPPLAVGRGRRRTRVAAAVVAGLLLATGVALLASGWLMPQGPDVVAQALQRYDAEASGRDISVDLATAYGRLVMPDLTPAGLQIAAFEPTVKLGERTAAHIAYVGARGCRLSFYAFARGSALPQPVARRDSQALVQSWTVGGSGYLLLARRMNRDRFEVIVEALKEATEHAVPLVERMRVAMANARQPCRA